MSHSTKQKNKYKPAKRKLRLFRSKEPVLSVVMWGINHSITELSHVKIPVMLMPDDFKAHIKVRVDNHLFNKDNMPSHFKFKEYCPLVFRNLRERFNVDDEQYLTSLTKTSPEPTDSPGRSGARFLNTWDQRFVIKTITSEEVAEMHRIMKDYHQFIVERRAESMLPQYMGMYRVTVNDNETYLIVMRNIFSPRLSVHRKYDLKGSTVDRQASDKEKAKDMPTFKDNDFVNDGAILKVGREAADKILQILNADTEFLSRLNLMDYSLLVGIHDMDKADIEGAAHTTDEENGVDDDGDDDDGSPGNAGTGQMPTPPDSPHEFYMTQPSFSGDLDGELERFAYNASQASNQREVYFLALVDILTHYGVKKRTAAAAKTVKHGSGAEISTVKPEQYARRFIDFIAKILE